MRATAFAGEALATAYRVYTLRQQAVAAGIKVAWAEKALRMDTGFYWAASVLELLLCTLSVGLQVGKHNYIIFLSDYGNCCFSLALLRRLCISPMFISPSKCEA